MSELDLNDGQALTDSTGTTGTAPAMMNGNASSQTTSGPDGMATESFFDPTDIIGTPLEAAYKQMQGAFTKKMQSYAKHQPKVEAYDQFMANPMGTLQQLAQQYGYQLVQPGGQEPEEWQPKTWEDVLSKAKQMVMKDIEPVMGEIQNMKKSNMETYLDNNYADWRTYEDSMIKTLKEHPTLAKNPDLLYEMALPPEVKQARAHKAAMSKIKAQTEASEVAGNSTKKPSQAPKSIKSLDEAVAYARQQLASKGLKAPGGY